MEKHVLCYQYYSFIAKKTLTYLLTFSFLCRIQEFEYVFSSPCLICGKFQFQSMILTAQSMILTALMVFNLYAHCMYTLHVLQYTLNVNVALQRFKLNVCMYSPIMFAQLIFIFVAKVLYLSLVFLLIINLTNGLRLHQFLGTCSPQQFQSLKIDANGAHQ